MAKKVAVIGSGCSGLTAIKCCLDEGLEPVCFERTNYIGGLWYYTDEIEEGQACVMKSTVINTSKEVMSYTDFPIPKEFPNFMHNRKVMEYFHIYADHFGLKKYMKFKTSVEFVKKADDFEQTGRWNLTIKDESGQERTECFDAVLVCTGHHASKKMATFPGMDEFQGKILHSHDYKTPDFLVDKRVIVVGIGNSGGDLIVEAANVADQVYLATRRGAWVINRVQQNGVPVDLVASRLQHNIFGKLPMEVLNTMWERNCNANFDHAKYSMKPKHKFVSQHPTANDAISNKIANGTVIVKPNIKKFTKTGVEFENGTFEDNIDVVILATGYIFGFPFIDKSVIDVQDNKVRLYKLIFPPDQSHNTLAVIGCFQPLGALMPISEMQCRLATRVFKGLIKLPSAGEIWHDINARERALSKRYVASTRHTIQVDWMPYMDELADVIGCKPNIVELFKTDISLALNVLLSPPIPYQYRLLGPGAWSGAREACMTLWDRVYYPLRTRDVGEDTKAKDTSQQIIKGIVLFLILSFLYRLIF